MESKYERIELTKIARTRWPRVYEIYFFEVNIETGLADQSETLTSFVFLGLL